MWRGIVRAIFGVYAPLCPGVTCMITSDDKHALTSSGNTSQWSLWNAPLKVTTCSANCLCNWDGGQRAYRTSMYSWAYYGKYYIPTCMVLTCSWCKVNVNNPETTVNVIWIVAIGLRQSFIPQTVNMKELLFSKASTLLFRSSAPAQLCANMSRERVCG